MSLLWTDTLDIAIELDEKFPEIDPKTVRFTDLRDWVLALEEFDDVPDHCGEKILEAIQMAWIEEREYAAICHKNRTSCTKMSSRWSRLNELIARLYIYL